MIKRKINWLKFLVIIIILKIKIAKLKAKYFFINFLNYIMKKIYKIHDNFGRPFKVEIDKDIKIFANDETNKLILVLKKYEEIFIGKPDGNSILIKLSVHRYIYIGYIIYSFSIPDEIISYKSPIGNNDVPYPYAIGTRYTYLMIEDIFLPNQMIGTNSPYDVYYGLILNITNKKLKKDIKKYFKNNFRIEEKIIHKRIL